MKYIFPKNYDISPKIFGYFDIQTLSLLVVINLILYFLLKIFISNIFLIIQFNIVLTLPIILLGVSGVNGENLYYFIYYIFKYFISKKVYLYE